MPLLPSGFGALERIKERFKTELGLRPKEQPPASSPAEILFRIREAAGQRPPKMIRALYQAKDATAPTWRYIAPYEFVYGRKAGAPSEPLLAGACEKDEWKTEYFRLDGFRDVQVSAIPFPAFIKYPSKITR